MRSDPEGVVEAACAAYALGDYEAAAAYYAEDATFALYADTEGLSFAGDWHGREAIVGCWRELAASFDILTFETRNMSAKGDVVRAQILYELRHKASGKIIDGVARFEAEVRDGLIVREREYNDVERWRAFMRLCE